MLLKEIRELNSINTFKSKVVSFLLDVIRVIIDVQGIK